MADHERVNIRESGISCGVMELSRISDETEAVVYAIASRLYHPSRGSPAAYIIWSDVVDKGDHETNSLNEFVLENKIGEMDISRVEENPKTGNLIAVFVWAINHTKFKDWYAKKRIKKLKKVGT